MKRKCVGPCKEYVEFAVHYEIRPGVRVWLCNSCVARLEAKLKSIRHGETVSQETREIEHMAKTNGDERQPYGR
jgi:hypothetical protein